MTNRQDGSSKRYRHPLLLCVLVMLSAAAIAQTPDVLIQQLEAYPHAVVVESTRSNVRDHDVGLGALQKRGGVWKFKTSKRISGILSRHTWQIIDGFGSDEVLADLVSELQTITSARELFSCDGRSCGKSVQWANRIFVEKLLYGREELQRYRVYAMGDADQYYIQLYSAFRSADRQYLHVEILEADPITASAAQPQ